MHMNKYVLFKLLLLFDYWIILEWHCYNKDCTKWNKASWRPCTIYTNNNVLVSLPLNGKGSTNRLCSRCIQSCFPSLLNRSKHLVMSQVVLSVSCFCISWLNSNGGHVHKMWAASPPPPYIQCNLFCCAYCTLCTHISTQPVLFYYWLHPCRVSHGLVAVAQ